jgi:hypothetical protein
MPFTVHFANAFSGDSPNMRVSIDMDGTRFGDHLEKGVHPGGLHIHELDTSGPRFFELRVIMRVWDSESSVTLTNIGKDDQLALMALPHRVEGSSRIGAFFLGNIWHLTPRAGIRHCKVSCDGRTQECCIECGGGHSRSKICC